MDYEEPSQAELERQYREKVRLSWALMAEIAPKLRERVGFAVTHPGGGQTDCLALIDSDGTPFLEVNRNGQAAAVNGALVSDVWSLASKSIRKTADRIVKAGKLDVLEPDEVKFGSVPNKVLGWSAAWLADVLEDSTVAVDWCWEDGQDGTGDYPGPVHSLKSQYVLPDEWTELPAQSARTNSEGWLFALSKGGNPLALLNTYSHEIVAAVDSPLDPLLEGPSLLGTHRHKTAAVPDVRVPSIPVDAQFALKYYVYALRNPLDQKIFYIGKGKGERIIQHKIFADSNPDVESAKLAAIHDIKRAGLSVEHLFIRTGIETEAEAFAIEQALIDLMTANGQKITNLVKGHHASEVGLRSLETFLADSIREPLEEVNQPIVMFKVHQDWSPDISAADLYKITRAFWGVSETTRKQAKYAFALAHGVVREVYRITNWEPTTDERFIGRWEFNGIPAPEMSDCVGKTVPTKKGQQSQFRVYLDGYPGPNV